MNKIVSTLAKICSIPLMLIIMFYLNIYELNPIYNIEH